MELKRCGVSSPGPQNEEASEETYQSKWGLFLGAGGRGLGVQCHLSEVLLGEG